MSSVYSLAVTEENGVRCLKFAGDLTINHIDKMAAEVKDAIDPIADLKVVINQPDNIDMTFIQMVLAIKRSCSEAGKKFDVSSSLKDDLKLLLEKSGLTDEFNI